MAPKTFTPPREVALLTAEERDAITGPIRAIARGRRPARKQAARTPRLRVVETHQDVPEVAIERNPGLTPPGQSEEPDT